MYFKKHITTALCMGVGLLLSSQASAQFIHANKAKQSSKYLPNQIIVKLKENQASPPPGQANRARILDRIKGKSKAKKVKPVFSGGSKASNKSKAIASIYTLTLQDGQNVSAAINAIKNDTDVEYAEPDYMFQRQLIPSDPFYPASTSWGQAYDDQWPLKQINMEPAWDIAKTSDHKVTVAVIDTGVDFTHPDLQGNMWRNSAEIPDNQIDDDGNGYIDDFYGYDFFDHTPSPMDDNGHGTHVAGTIGAVTDNAIGMAGVALNVRVMPLKGLNAMGYGPNSALSEAIVYAVDNGAQVINMSFGSFGSTSRTMTEAVRYAHAQGAVLIAAAGNAGAPVELSHPANIQEVISVGATTYEDTPSFYSNYGDILDVVAPGGGSSDFSFDSLSWNNILSLRSSLVNFDDLDVGEGYVRFMGTSMAAPHVSGLAAMLLSVNSDMSNEEVRQQIRLSAKDLGEVGQDPNYGYGRVDAYEALKQPLPGVTAYIQPQTTMQVTGAVDIRGYVGGRFLKRYELWATHRDSGSTQLIASGEQPISQGGVLGHWQPELDRGDGYFDIQLRVFSRQGNVIKYDAAEYVDTQGWPIEVIQSNHGEKYLGLSFSDFSVADLDNDGELEIIVRPMLRHHQNISVYDTQGKPRTGWPVEVEIEVPGAPVFSEIDTMVITGDISGNSRQEVMTLSKFIGENNVYAYDADGKSLPGWPVAYESAPGDLTAKLMLSDINDDGVQDLVLATHFKEQANMFFGANIEGSFAPPSSTTTSIIQAWDHQGESIPGWPQHFSSTQKNALFAAQALDLDGDGRDEVIAVHGDQVSGYRIAQYHGNGNLKHEYHLSFPSLYQATQLHGITAADLDNDGSLELILPFNVDRHPAPEAQVSDGLVYAIKQDGSVLDGWPVVTDHQPNHISIADLGGDGCTDVVINTGTEIAAYDCRGGILPGWPKNFHTPKSLKGDALLGDIDGDQQVDVLVTQIDSVQTPGQVYLQAWSHQGEPLAGFPRTIGEPLHDEFVETLRFLGVHRNAILADVDNDGRSEILTAYGHHISRIDTNALASADTLPWPMSDQNSSRTGIAPALVNASPIPPLASGVDLVSHNVSISTGDGSFTPTVVSGVVCNNGNDQANEAFSVALRAYEPSSDASISSMDQHNEIAALATGECAAIAMPMANDLLYDELSFELVGDVENAINERNEGNNLHKEKLPLASVDSKSTDFALDIRQSATEVNINEPVNYVFTVTNHGPGEGKVTLNIVFGTAVNVVDSHADCALYLPPLVNFSQCLPPNEFASGESQEYHFTVEYLKAGDYSLHSFIGIYIGHNDDPNWFNDEAMTTMHVIDTRPEVDLSVEIDVKAAPYLGIDIPVDLVVRSPAVINNRVELSLVHSVNLDLIRFPEQCVREEIRLSCEISQIGAAQEIRLPLLIAPQDVGYMNLHVQLADLQLNDPVLSNNRAARTLYVQYHGDVNEDGQVDSQDRALLSEAMHSCEGDQAYHARADLNGDDCITLKDLAIWQRHHADFKTPKHAAEVK
ncbi:S8 family serine peptidase [Pseudomonadota bacterium]